MGVAVNESGDDLKVRLLQAAEVAARFPITLRDAAQSFQRLSLRGAAAADQFRDTGVNAWLGLTDAAKMGAEDSIKAWDAAFAQIEKDGTSAISRLADSYEGRMSMLSDAWFRLRANIAQGGLMDGVKAGIASLTDTINQLANVFALSWEQIGAAAYAGGIYIGAQLAAGILRGVADIAGKIDPRQFIPVFGDDIVQRLNPIVVGFGALADEAARAGQEAKESLRYLLDLGQAGADANTTTARERERRENIIIPAAPTGARGISADAPDSGLSRPATPFDRADITANLDKRMRDLVPDGKDILPDVTAHDVTGWAAEWRPRFDSEMSDFDKDLAAGAIAIGENLINGLIDGTLDMMDVLKSALKIVVSVITGGLTSGLGIFSPSRVTYGFGQNIVQGMMLGMDSMTQPLATSTRRLAGIVTNELGAVTSATVAGGIALPQVGGLGATVGEPLKLQATINTDDTSRHPPWALDWLAQANVELRYSGEP
jgi:hypothetical protein